MSFSKIQGTPAQISLFFTPVDASPPTPTSHPLGAPSEALILGLLVAQLPPSAQSALTQLLSTPLDQFFDTAWQQLEGQAKSTVIQSIQGAVSDAFNISVNFPAKGTLQAQVGGLSFEMQDTLPPGTTGSQLTLQYLLPGVSCSFSTHGSGIWGGWADPAYNLTFDATIEIAVAVPSQTAVPLGARAQFLVQNMQAGAANAYAVVNGIVNLIGAWLNDQPGGQGGALGDQIIVLDIPPIRQLFAELSSGFATASQYGFLELVVQINANPPADTPPGNTVEFDIKHAWDTPGPKVINANAPAPGVPNLLASQLVPSFPQVNAGATLGVTGSYFPAAQATQLVVTWGDVASGSVSQSEVEWGPADSSGQASPLADVKIPRTGPYDNANTFTATSLTASTPYAFRVRDYDVEGLVATDWGPWAVLMTMPTDQVELVLGDPSNTVVGSATLKADGSFSTTIAVPAAVPPGTYTLWAVLSGQQMAQATITVIGVNDSLPTVLQFVDPSGVPYGAGTVLLISGSQATVAGANFRPGTVDVFIDSPSGAALGNANVGFDGTFTFGLTWPWGVVGAHTIHAQQAADFGDAPLYAEMPAK